MRWRSEFNYPPGGWVYTTPEGFLIRREGLEPLVRAVREHFAGLGLSGGDAEAKVHAQLCERFPALCHSGEPNPPLKKIEAPATNPLLRAVMGHIDRAFLVPAGNAPTHDAEVTRRLGVCAACPAARETQSLGCAKCASTIRDARQALGARSTDWATAPVCSAMGVDCFVAARRGILQPTPETTRLPAKCWAAAHSSDPVHDTEALAG